MSKAKFEAFETYTRMLLIGMWMSLTTNPIVPINANPMAVAIHILVNSGTKRSELVI